ncbi:MAG: enoyl-CoA hydratase/isomerase family protein [Phycisphaerales bacterium]|nr:enoyl-CoA hydratase/isomerase family protein [Phycisphaerales bacterium]
MKVFVEQLISDHIGHVQLRRPDLHNAFNEQVIEQLADVFRELGRRDDVRAIVLSGEGKSFCAGADLNWMQKMVDYTFEENVADATQLASMLDVIRCCPKPTIARVHGATFGGGVGLVAACDIAVALERVVFCLSEVKLGIAPAIIMPFLTEKMQASAVQRYALTAERFDGVEAKRVGLVAETVKTVDELDETVGRLTDAIKETGPCAVAACKEIIRTARGDGFDGKLAAMTLYIAKLRASGEGQEGLKAFLQKREPGWRA